MTISKKYLVAAGLIGSVACHGDFLTGGEVSTDPNRPLRGSTAQFFVGVQSNVYYTYSGDIVRIAGLFSQTLTGGTQTYVGYYQYAIDEGTSNGGLRQLYASGGLSDVRREEASAIASDDSLFLGIAQVQEAMLMGFAADVYGDIVYTHALKNESNPPLDKQLDVYDSLQVLLGRAIVNMAATSSTNVGPTGNDISYGGDAAKWTKLAHTLKARFFMHTAEVRGAAAYDSALVHAQLGILDPADDYKAVFSGSQLGETNPWFQFDGPAGRGGYYVPGTTLDSILVSRHDPRRTDYFAIDDDSVAVSLSDARLDPSYSQPIATAAETHLIWAEAAYRTGDPAAVDQLNIERGYVGLAPEAVTGPTLLAEILTEEYINDFQLGDEAWKLYRRTCFPNLSNTSPTGTQMPGRLYYDTEERLTNTSIPKPGTDPNGKRNQVDPANATSDVGGAACLAGA